ncbi:hypothetical protein [Virgisporangium ochraceum]|uniref:Uncharacterized protein n=1 Tax=Virgisporangium ochraceum TaxID=65505 RepID=A0A8J4EG59_9ACTN|nr:hypothetical protein [Virgisporangium ochraceum]GIJ73421.1 hypothetical protein Voc01_083380 [Virgisporangium ochraceum]
MTPDDRPGRGQMDDRLGRALITIGDALRPAPDPYGRVLARRRRSTRRRLVAVAAAALTLALGVTATAAGWTRPDTPPAQSESDRQFANANAWAGRLADGPTHGAVGADAAYVEALAAGMMRNWREGRYDVERLSVDRVTVPFVDDVGPYRLALVVMVLTRPDERGWPYASAWLYGDRGAPAAALTEDARIGHGLEAYSHVSYSSAENTPTVHVAVVPPQCRFATTTTPADPDWTPEPTGSFIVRTGPTEQREWWQVDCNGGDVRAELPAPNRGPGAGFPTDAQVTESRAHERVPSATADVRRCLLSAAQPDLYAPLAGLPYVVWIGGAVGGQPEGGGLPPADRGALTVARLDKGGWTAQVLTGWSQEAVAWTPTQRYAVTGDPTRADYTFVLRLRPDAPEHLVLPSAGATLVRATYRGRPVAEAPVTDGAARLSVPVPFDDVEALDAAGTVVGRGVPAEPLSTSDTGVIDRWWED